MKTNNKIEPSTLNAQASTKEEVLVRVSGVSKKFARDLKSSLRYGVQDITREVFGKPRKTELRKSEFWAVKDVSFELKRGECLGLIGHNGAGKSTLLKMLNGLIKPDEGRIEMHGRVAALIELGTGFNPILTGRENIYNNASVLGFTKEEVDAKYQDILDFAEIGDFIDTPVQSYSSGMKVRLGFAVAAQMEPDILLIDEVLAVGDVNFRAKCYDRISELMSKCTFILVTHGMPQVSKICTGAILFNKGKIYSVGYAQNIGDVIEDYYRLNSKGMNETFSVIFSKYCRLEYFKTEQSNFSNNHSSVKIFIGVHSDREINNVELNVVLMNRALAPICQGSSKFDEYNFNLKEGLNEFIYEIENLYLNTGEYNFSFTVDSVESGFKYLWVQKLNKIIITNQYTGVSPVIFKGSWNANV